MLIRSSTTVKTRVVALAGALLATLVAISLLYSFVYAQGGGQVIEYPENQTSPVHDFAASDPEGVTPIVWTLSGKDAGTPSPSWAACWNSRARPTTRTRRRLTPPLTPLPLLPRWARGGSPGTYTK